MSDLERAADELDLRTAAEDYQAHVKQGAGRGGVSYGQAEMAAKKMLRNVRPGGGRARTLKAIAEATGKNDVLMAWFADGTINSETVGDIFGEPLWTWKENEEIDEDDEYEDLSRDRQLAKMIAQQVKKWLAKGGSLSGEMPRDYSEAKVVAGWLNDLLRNLSEARSYNEEKDRQEALSHVKKLHGLLK